MTEQQTELTYWDIFPQSIRLSQSLFEQRIPLSIRGLEYMPLFDSSNPSVAYVDEDGFLVGGRQVGNAMIMAWDSELRQSLRHLNVEVRDTSWFVNHPDFLFESGGSSGRNIYVSGSVVDALNTRPIAGVLITIRRSEEGPIVAQQITDESGQYELELFEGLYAYEASVANYIDAHGLLNVSESGNTGQNIVLSPELNGQVARIVLQWGLNPRDLDSHLRGPRVSGGQFHVYYAHDYEPDGGELDVDDTSSYGPETITIHRLVTGTYRYSVHDYTNRNSNSSTGLASSGATVKVFFYNDREYTFNVPNQPGTVWNVFEINGTTGEIIPLNQMEFESNPGNVGIGGESYDNY